jgi:hypothetical protein
VRWESCRAAGWKAQHTRDILVWKVQSLLPSFLNAIRLMNDNHLLPNEMGLGHLNCEKIPTWECSSFLMQLYSCLLHLSHSNDFIFQYFTRKFCSWKRKMSCWREARDWEMLASQASLYRELNGLLVSFTFHIHYKGFSLSISLFTFSLISAPPSLLCAAAFLSYLSVLKRVHFHIQREWGTLRNV